jgi:hypothetical protein
MPDENTLTPCLARRMTARNFASRNEPKAAIASLTSAWLSALRRRSSLRVMVPTFSTTSAVM